MSEPQQIIIEASPLAANRLTEEEISLAANTVLARAKELPGWGVGKSYRIDFAKEGTTYSVAIDYRPDGFRAFVGLPQEVTMTPPS